VRVPIDAGPQDLIDRFAPPVLGKNLDLAVTLKPFRLHRTAHRSDVDHAVAHHAAVVENVLGRHQPVADMKRQQAALSGARNLPQQLYVPPDVIDVECNTERAGAAGIEAIANIERLSGRVDAGAVGRIGRMQRLDCKRHPRVARVFHHLGDGFLDLRARGGDVF
jgi:hypothetical protein